MMCQLAIALAMVKGTIDAEGSDRIDGLTEKGASKLINNSIAKEDDWIPGDWGYVKNPSINQEKVKQLVNRYGQGSPVVQMLGATAGENIMYLGGGAWGGFLGQNGSVTRDSLQEWQGAVGRFPTNKTGRGDVLSIRQYPNAGIDK